MSMSAHLEKPCAPVQGHGAFSYWRGQAVERRSRRSLARLDAVSAAASEASRRNLEEITLEPQGVLSEIEVGKGLPEQFTANIVQYADGFRVTLYRSPRLKFASDAPSTVLPVASADSLSESAFTPIALAVERSIASTKRSRSLVVHRARCLQPHSMWTFTKRGKFASADDVWSAWRLFAQMMRRRFKREWAYVAVPELHRDGQTWHLHVLFGRFYMVETLRRYWYRALGGSGSEQGDQTPGSVNVKSLRSRHSAGLGAARYIAKYVGKGFERGGLNRRVFASSIGLRPLQAQKRRDTFDQGLFGFADAVGRWLREHFGVERIYPRFYVHDTFSAAVIDTG